MRTIEKRPIRGGRRRAFQRKPTFQRKPNRTIDGACCCRGVRPWMAASGIRGGDVAAAHSGIWTDAIPDGSHEQTQKKMAQGGAIGGTHLAWAKKLLPRLP